VTKPGRQWIHADAGYYRDALVLRIKERFGWSGVVFFDAFLRGCKRSVPQGQVTYLSEEELVHFLGVADLPLVSCAGHAWTITEFWRFMARRRPAMVRSSTRDGLTMVTSCAWDEWEMSAASAAHAERMRRSRAQKRATNVAQTSHECAAEVGGWRGEKKTVEGGVQRGESAGSASASAQGADASPAHKNGAAGRPDPSALVAMVAAMEAQTAGVERDPTT
jgi:hypothetical protein